MNLGRLTTFSWSLTVAVLLFAAVANAQFVPQNGIAVGEPYGANPYSLPPNIYAPQMPAPSYVPWTPYQQTNPIFQPSYNNSFMNPYLLQMPQNNFMLPSYNYSLPALDYSSPSYDLFSNPYSENSSGASSEEEEERREREEERREEREERREEKRREREEEREERKREERRERERERRGERAQGASDQDEPSRGAPPVIAPPVINNWPPVPKSSARAAEVVRAQQSSKPAPAAPSRPAAAAQGAAEGRVAQPAAQTKPEAKKPNWWESNPEYQKYLRDKKAYEESQKVRPDWPPKPKPVATVPAPQKQIQSTTGKLEASAETCHDCGVQQGPLAQQIQELSKAVDPREVFIYSKPPPTKVSEGIRKVMNTIYQSCDAYNTLLRPDYCQEGFIGQSYCAKTQAREPGDLTAFNNPKEFHSYKIASQPGSNVMTPTKPEGPQCRDMNKTPPVFRTSTNLKSDAGIGRPKISRVNGKIQLNLFNEEKAGGKFVTMDCSGFVSAAFTAAGLNFVPNVPAAQVTTKSMREGRATCLSTVEFTPNESLKSGDVAVFAGESQHSLIFDRVGADPFGLGQIATEVPKGKTPAQHCWDNLKPSKFDFVIAQSGLYGGRVAVSQARAVDYVVNFGKGYMDGINLQIMNMGVDACVAKLTGVNKKADRGISGSKLLRHKGASAPGCVRSAPTEIVGQQCVKGCT